MPPDFYKPLVPWHVPSSSFSQYEKPFTVSHLFKKTQLIRATIHTKTQTSILVNLAYFPTWHVFVDNKQVWFNYFAKGILITMPPGTHDVVIVYSETPVEKLGNVLSLTGVIILIIGIITTRRRVYEQEKR